jgi:hypothetical protein
VAAFPIPDYGVSREGIRDSLPFHVIQPATGAKFEEILKVARWEVEG